MRGEREIGRPLPRLLHHRIEAAGGRLARERLDDGAVDEPLVPERLQGREHLLHRQLRVPVVVASAAGVVHRLEVLARDEQHPHPPDLLGLVGH